MSSIERFPLFGGSKVQFGARILSFIWSFLYCVLNIQRVLFQRFHCSYSVEENNYMMILVYVPSLPLSSLSFSDHLRQQTVKMTHQLKQQRLTLKSGPPHHLPPLKDETSKPPLKITRKKSSKSSTSVTLKKEEVCVGMQIVVSPAQFQTNH